MAKKRILLTRLWDGHEAGEIVEEADYTVESMVRKGYGQIVTAKDIKEREKAEVKITEKTEAEAKLKAAKGKGPKVETADAPPAAENAAVTPQSGKAGE